MILKSSFFRLGIILLLPLFSINLFGQESSLVFDGTDDYVDLNHNSGLPISTASTAFTIEFWVKGASQGGVAFYSEGNISDVDAPQFIIGSGTSVADKLRIYFVNDAGSVLMNNQGAITVLDNTWHHVAYVQEDATNALLYVDGVLDQNNTYYDHSHTGITPDNTTLGAVRTNGTTANADFNGKMDELRVWSVAKTQSEIQQNYLLQISSATPNLNAYFRFDEGSGNPFDLTLNANDGTLNGDVAYDNVDFPSLQLANYALSFNGTSDYVTISDDPSFDFSDGYTLEFWFNITSISSETYGALIANRDANDADANFMLFVDARSANGGSSTNPVLNVIAGGGGANYNQLFTPALNNNQWYHLAQVVDGTKHRIYLDGAEVGNTNFVGTIQSSSQPILLGYEDSYSSYSNVQLDEVRIWKDARSADQINAFFDSELNVPMPQLVSYYKMDVSASELTDATATNPGTITGATQVFTGPVLGEASLTDATPPTLSNVSIGLDASGNNNYAKAGEDVVLTFESDEQITSINLVFTSGGNAIGKPVNITGGPLSWEARYQTSSSDTEGAIAFSIDYQDLTGNNGISVTSVTDATFVNLDKTLPTITGTSISSDNTTLTVDFSEDVFQDIGGLTAVKLSNFGITITGGTATGGATGINVISGTQIEITLDISGTPNGSEQVKINPVASNVYDIAGNEMAASQSNNIVNLIANPYVVTNKNDSGTGSLRWAMANANASGSKETITFSIVAGSVINLSTVLPAITTSKGMIIDASSAGDWSLSGDKLIVIDGSNVASTLNGAGFRIGTSGLGIEIYGFKIQGFTTGLNDGLLVEGDNNTIGKIGGENVIVQNNAGLIVTGTANIIQANYIGTDFAGTDLGNAEDGIRIEGGATDNLIGGEVSGEGNTIYFNGTASDHGIRVTGNTTVKNRIIANSMSCNGATGIYINNLSTTAQNEILEPTITDITATKLTGMVDASISAGADIHVYISTDACDNKQGATYLGKTSVLGDGSFTYDIGSTSSDAYSVTVTTTEDGTSEMSTAGYYSVFSLADSGVGSLRAALELSNAIDDQELFIDFNLSGGGLWQIDLSTELPLMNSSFVLDGSTQEGFDFDNGKVVTINGANAVNRILPIQSNSGSDNVSINNLRFIGAKNSVISTTNTGTGQTNKLSIGDNVFGTNGDGSIDEILNIQDGTNVTIEANYFGFDHTGLGTSEQITGSAVVIGTFVDSVSIGGNVIGNYSSSAINLDGINNYAKVEYNLIGLDFNGTEAAPATSVISDGIVINSSNVLIIGNYIANTQDKAIEHQIFGIQNITLQGNFIGTDVDGDVHPVGTGIYLPNRSDYANFKIGGAPADGNTITNTTNNAIFFVAGGLADNVRITGNSIFGNGAGIIFNGANASVSAPVVSALSTSSISGTGTDGEQIHIYQADANGQPQTFLDSVLVQGDNSWTYSFSPALNQGDEVMVSASSATATSEFVPAALQPEINVKFADNPVANGGAIILGEELVGVPGSTETVIIENTGFGDLVISNINGSVSNYNYSQPTASIITSQSQTDFTVQLSPIAGGAISESISVLSNDADESTFVLQLQGFGYPNEAGPGTALDFDDTDDYIDAGTEATLNITGSITLEAWVNPRPGSGIDAIIEKHHTVGDRQFGLRLNADNTISFLLYDNGDTQHALISSANLPDDEWVHIAASYDQASGEQILYINGEVETSANIGSLSLASKPNLPMTIGAYWNDGGYTLARDFFSGQLDEIRIWREAVSQADIQSYMLTNDLTGHPQIGTDDLVAYYRFDEGEGETLFDLSFDNDGTLTNMDAGSDWVLSEALSTTPQIVSQTPLPGAVDVIPNTTITVDFDQNVIAGTGNIAILNQNSEIVEQFDVQTAEVDFSGTTVSFTPTLLAYNTEYRIELPQNTVMNLSGKSIIAVLATAWTFTTQAQTITVDQPDGGIPFEVGETISIAWTATGFSDPNDNLDITYSRNGSGGPFDLTIYSGPVSNVGDINGGTFGWVADATTTSGVFQVENSTLPAFGQSANVIITSPTITSAVPFDVTNCVSPDGVLLLQGLLPSTVYDVYYTLDGISNIGPLNIQSDVSGEISILDLDAGDYTDIYVEIFTELSNVLTGPYQILSPPLSVSFELASILDPSTIGGNDGQIDLSGTVGVTDDYSFQWYLGVGTTNLAGFSGPIFTGLIAGDYTVVVTDMITGCQTTPETFILTDPTETGTSQTEDFNSLDPSITDGILSLPTGDWFVTSAYGEDNNTNEGAASLGLLSASNGTAITPPIDGDNTTVSFYHAAAGGEVVLQIYKSVDGGSDVLVAEPPVNSPFEQYSFTLNEGPGTSVQVKVLADAAGSGNVLIDDFTFTPFPVAPITEDFETYTGISGLLSLATGDFHASGVIAENVNVNSGGKAILLERINNPVIVTPPIQGNSDFEIYHSLAGAGTAIVYIQQSVDGGSYNQIGFIEVTSTSYEPYLITLTEAPSSSVRLSLSIDFNAGADLIIDDISFIPYTGPNTYPPVLENTFAFADGLTTAFTSPTVDLVSDYYYVVTTSSSPPTITQIKAGQDDSGSSALNSGLISGIVGRNDIYIGTGSNGVNDVALPEGTALFIYSIVEESNNPGNVSTVYISSITTPLSSNVEIATIDVPGGDLVAGSTNNLIYKVALNVSGGDVDFYQVSFFPTVTDEADFTQFKFYQSIGSDNFEDALLSPPLATSGFYLNDEDFADGSIGFLSEDIFTASSTVYIYVTVDVSLEALESHSISIAKPVLIEGSSEGNDFNFGGYTTQTDGGLTASNTFNILPKVPLFTDGPFVDEFPTENSVLFGFTIDEDATVYVVAELQSDPAPGVENVRLGQDAAGGTPAAATFDPNILSGISSGLTISGLVPGTDYTAYFVVENGSGNYDTGSPVALNFTTTGTQPPITITSPNGGETLIVGETFTITWLDNFSPSDELSIRHDNGTSGFIEIVNGTGTFGSLGGSFNWLVPNDVGSSNRIQIFNITNGELNDVSDAFFNIAGDLTSPSVINLTTSINPVTDTNAGLELELLIEFDEEMKIDGSADPIVTFPVEDASPTLAVSSYAWDDGVNLTVFLTITDADQNLSAVDVRIAGAQDIAGNILNQYDGVDVFDINMGPIVVTNYFENFSLGLPPDWATQGASWEDNPAFGFLGEAGALRITSGTSNFAQTPDLENVNYISFQYRVHTNNADGAVFDIYASNDGGISYTDYLGTANDLTGTYNVFTYNFVSPYTGAIQIIGNGSGDSDILIDDFATDGNIQPGAQVFVVTTTADDDVTPPVGSLREAINLANAASTDASITFSLPGDGSGGSWIISPLTPLPALFNSAGNTITIDGSTQSGWSRTSDNMVVLDGQSTINSGLALDGDKVEIYGLKLINFDYAIYSTAGTLNNIIIGRSGGENVISNNIIGIYIEYSNGLIIQNNYIGTDVTGSFAEGNEDGINLGFEANFTDIHENVVSGNTGIGIYIPYFNNSITNNKIGVSDDGMTVLGNHIGIKTNGDGFLIEGNQIGGNSQAGIQMDGFESGNHIIRQNYIGTDITGSEFQGNGIGIEGLNYDETPSDVTEIGADDDAFGNIIAFNTNAAISLSGTAFTKVKITNNSIYENGYGIELLNGADGGQNPPTIDFVGTSNVDGSIEGVGPATIHLYGVDPNSSAVQGKIVRGVGTVDPGVSSWSIGGSFVDILDPSELTATVTTDDFGTSEFFTQINTALSVNIEGTAVTGGPVYLDLEGSAGVANQWGIAFQLTTGDLTFKLDDTQSFGDDDGDFIADPEGFAITVSSDGLYFISFNADTYFYDIAEITTVGFIGSARTGGADGWDDPDTDMTDLGGGLYELKNFELFGGEWKIRINDQYLGNWGDEEDDGNLDLSGANIVAGSGTYDITVDIISLLYSVTPVTVVTDFALEFDGSNEYVNIPHSADFNFDGGDFTISFWIKQATATDGEILSKRSNGSPNGLIIGVFGGNYSIWASSGSGWDVFNGLAFATVDDDVWTQIAVVRSGGDWLFYKNGIEESSVTAGGLTNNTDPITLGLDLTGIGALTGQLDELQIWNIALDATTIGNEYQNARGGFESGLVAYYPFDDGPASIGLTDITANGNNGFLNGFNEATDWVASGVGINPAFVASSNFVLDFDGVDDYAQAGTLEALSGLTEASIEAWVYRDGATAGDIFGQDNFNFTIGADGTVSTNFLASTTRGPISSSGAVLLNRWTHVAVVFDASLTGADRGKIYIDGVLDAGGSFFGDPNDVNQLESSSNMLFIARSPYFDGNHFDGKIDDARIWNYARTDQEIADNYDRRMSGFESGLIAYYDFEEETGTIAADLSPNGNFAELINPDGDEYLDFGPALNDPAPYLSIIYPFAGISVFQNTDVSIVYSGSGFTNGDELNLEWSDDGGSLWNFAGQDFYNNEDPIFIWTVDAGTYPVGSNYSIRLSNQDFSISTESATFSIIEEVTPDFFEDFNSGMPLTPDPSFDLLSGTWTGQGAQSINDPTFAVSGTGDAAWIQMGLENNLTTPTLTNIVAFGFYYRVHTLSCCDGAVFDVYASSDGGSTFDIFLDVISTNFDSYDYYSHDFGGVPYTGPIQIVYNAGGDSDLIIDDFEAFNSPTLSLSDNVLDFDGVDDMVEIPTFTADLFAEQVTIEFWVKPMAGSGVIQDVISIDGADGTDVLTVRYIPNNDYFEISSSGGGLINSSFGLTDGEWHHFAISVLNGLADVFQDGYQVGQSNDFFHPINGDLWTLGGNWNGTTYDNPFQGVLDEVRIYNEAKEWFQVRSTIGITSLTDESGLLISYDFNQGNAGGENSSESFLKDLSLNRFDGSLQNFSLAGATSNWITSDIESMVVTAPSVQASNVNAGALNVNTAYVTWDRGDGERNMLLAREGNSGFPDPVDGESYFESVKYGDGDLTNNGFYTIANGFGGNGGVYLGGLKPNVEYTLAVVEVNGPYGYETYNVSTATSNPITFVLPTANVNLTEEFETNIPLTQDNCECNLPTGIWGLNQSYQENTIVQSGTGAVRLVNTEGAEMHTPSLDGASEVNFYYATPAGGENNFEVYESVDGGFFDQVVFSGTATSTSYQLATINLTHPGSIVQLRILPTFGANDQDLLIDQFNADFVELAIPPVLIASVSAVDSYGVQIDVDVDRTSNLFYVITTSDQAPSVAQVSSGLNELGDPADNFGSYSSVTGTEVFQIGLSGVGGDQPLLSNTTYYSYWVADDGAGGVSEVAITGSFTTLADPSQITISSVPLTNSNVDAGSTGNLIYELQVDIAETDAVFEGFFLIPQGTYAESDFVQFELFHSIGVDDFAGATSLGTTGFLVGDPFAPDGSIGLVVSETYSAGTTVYLYIAADIAAGAAVGNNINIQAPLADGNFGFAEPADLIEGTINAGATFTITPATSTGIVSGSATSTSGTGFDFSTEATLGMEDQGDYQPDFVFVQNEGVNFGNEGSSSLASTGNRFLLLGTGALSDITTVASFTDAAPWVNVSYDFTSGTGGAPIAVGELWAVYTREGHYAVMEITDIPGDPLSGTEFSFDYKYQPDGSPVFGTSIDVTPPSFISGSPFAGDILDTSVQLFVETDEDATVYVVVLPSTDTPPNVFAVRDLQDAIGSPVASSVQQSITGNNPTILTVENLLAGTDYTAYIVGESSAVFGTTPLTVNFTTVGGDTTPPSFINSTPVTSTILQTSAQTTVETDEAGTVYGMVLSSSDPIPTSLEVKDGTAPDGGTLYSAGSVAIVANNPTILSFGALTANTEYTAYYVAEDASNNLSATPVSVTFSTLAPATAPVFLNGTPAAADILETSAQIQVETDKDAIIYIVALLVGDAAPNVFAVRDLQDASGSPVASSVQQSITGNNPTILTVENLTAGTDYTAYIVGESSAVFGTTPLTVNFTTTGGDVTAPVVSINGITTNDQTPALFGLIDDNTATISVTVAGQTNAATNNGDGTWSLVDNLLSIIVEGVYDVQVSATDSFGNIGTDQTTDELTIDITAPTVSINNLSTLDDTPALSGSVNDAQATVSVSVSGQTLNAVVNPDLTWTIADNIILSLAVNTYDIVVTATDLAGNVGTDQTSDELTILPGAPTAVAAINVDYFTFTANWNARAGVSTYRIDVASDPGFVNLVPNFSDRQINSGNTSNVTGLNYGTRYYYRVRAVYSSGDISPNSNVIVVKTLLDQATVNDSTALLSIYRNTGGADTWSNVNWEDNVPLRQWNHVDMQGTIRVKSVNLNGVGLVGDIPVIDSGLEELVTLDLGNNKLRAIPNLSGLTSLTSLVLVNNRLEFGSIEPNFEIPGALYNPQDSVGAYAEALYEISANAYTINRQITGNGLTYNWFKLDRNGANRVAIDGVSGPELSLTISSFNDEGYYFAEVTSSFVPGLTLRTQSFFVKVSSLERDRLALTELFNATGGTNWINKTGWLTATNVDDWAGVDTDAEGLRVVSINLPNNNMIGDVPRSFADISGLVTINFNGNELRSFPNMSKVTGINSLLLDGNRLLFKHLIPNLNVTGFSYSNQRRFGNTITLKEDASSNVILDNYSTVDFGTGSTYQWKFGQYIPGQEFNDNVLPLNGANNKSLTISELDITEQGTYRLEVSHPSFPDLTISSRNINLLAQTDFFGKVFLDGTPVTDAEIVVWRQTPSGPFEKEDSTFITSAGEYIFEDVALGTFVVVAKPNRDLPAYQRTIQTYYLSAETYEEADRLLLDKATTGVNIDLISFTPFEDGTATISGIMESEFDEEIVDEESSRITSRRKVKKAGCAMRRFKVQGRDEQDDVEEEIAYYVETDDEGYFNFSEVADGKYLLTIEFPGVPIDQNAEVVFEIGGDRENQIFDVNVLITEAGIEVTQEEILYTLKPYIKDVVIYPNPTEGVMALDYLVYRDIDDLKIQLISSQGIVLLDNKVDHFRGQQHAVIDLTEFSVGIYYLVFTDEAGTFASQMKVVRK